MNYVPFRIIQIDKRYLFKGKKLWNRIRSVLICTRIFFFTWNFQNKIIIGHWDVELAMILSVLIFQVFVGVLILACEHPPEKINGDLFLKPFKNKINSLSINNNQK